MAWASLLAGCASLEGQEIVVRQGLVLDGVTVVGTRDGSLTADRAVVIEGGEIVRIAPAGSVRALGKGRLVDARGKFVTPGYLDMHAHPLTTSDPAGSLRLMLAAGVTGYRQMSGSAELLERRRAGAFGEPDQPALLAMPGQLLVGPVALTPQAASGEVARQKAQGADFIKFIDAPEPALFAALQEARRQGLTVSGHVPSPISVEQASAGGFKSVEHLGESLLIACSVREEELRAEIARAAPPPRPPGGNPAQAAAAAERNLVNPLAGVSAPALARTRQILDSYNEARCRSLARTFAANGTWQAPTLIRLRTMRFGDDPRYLNDPNLRYVPPATRALWASVAEQFRSAMTPASRETLARSYAAQARLVKLFHESGVPMMAGSDLGGGYVVAGFGLHQEFDLLAEAGLPPLAVLQMATLNGARFLELEDTLGTVEAGKRADLVVLDANPLESVANFHRISGVVRDGRYYSQEQLEALRVPAPS